MTTVNFANALGLHPSALLIRAYRSEVLANNLANTDTPHFKARDIDFNAVLTQQAQQQQSLSLQQTQQQHLPGKGPAQYTLQYRWPSQPAIDGNTVDDHIEHAQFSKNALDYQSSLHFLSGKFRTLQSAIRGE